MLNISTQIPENSPEKVYLAIKYLVEVSKERQIKQKGNRSFLGPKKFAKELCSVRAMTSRGSGHTSAIIRLIKDDLIHTSDQRIAHISLNNMLLELAREDAKNNQIDQNIIFATDPISLAGREFSAIICDCSWCLSERQIENIYDIGIAAMLRSNDPFYFIFVQ